MLEGVLNINKPKGISSYGVVEHIKKTLKVKKVGHAGTLDPDATGVLLVCLGKATKIVQFLMGMEKEYRGQMVLGVTTDTEDAQGTVISRQDNVNIPESRIREVFEIFHGELNQVPPMVSALKYNGRRLYDLAREGKTVERKARKVQIYKLNVLGYKENRIDFSIVCSKGTYIRALCRDIGEELGCGAHLSSLTRARIGAFDLKDALLLGELENNKKNIDTFLYSMDKALEYLPKVVVDNQGAMQILDGKLADETHIMSYPRKTSGLIRINNVSNKLLAVAHADSRSEKVYKLVRVLS
ncbi:MAG: tRNA pseudouridine(55) synthase TruB [bacterium]